MFSKLPPNMRAPVLIALSFLLLLAAYFILFTREYIETDRGFSKAAQLNPFLAAQLYLAEKTHVTWRSHQALRRLDSGVFTWQDHHLKPGDTLILANAYGSFSEEETDNLWAWVEHGGHLIYHLDNPFINANRIPLDPMLRKLGLELANTRDVAGTDAVKTIPENKSKSTNKPNNYVQKLASKPAEHCYQSRHTVLISLPQQPHPAVVDLGPGRGIVLGDDSPAPLWPRLDTSPLRAAAFGLGQGRITFLNSLSAWENTRIDCGDHGYFLKNAIGPGATVAWFLNLDAPNLWQRLWALAPEALMASALALITWLWHVNVRFGEPLVTKPTQRRVFLDHFKAWANYLWRAPLICAQIAAQRQDCLQRTARRVPGFTRLSPSEQLLRLEQLTGLTPVLLQQALFSPIDHQAQRITDIIFALQQLRNHL